MRSHMQQTVRFLIKTGLFIVMAGLIPTGNVDVRANDAPNRQKEAERALGECLALDIFTKYGPPAKDEDLQKYVSLVGNALVRNLPGPSHSFHFIVIGGTFYRSFGLPGGIIILGESQLKKMTSEAELAALLANEIAHVKYKHALQLIEKQKPEKLDADQDNLPHKSLTDKKFISLVEQLQHILFERGLTPKMILEADTFAMELLYRTGYNPESMINLLKQMKTTPPVLGSNQTPIEKRIEYCLRLLEKFTDYKNLAVNSKRFESYIKP